MNKGGITANDGKEQIMAMITGASVSNVDIATQVRYGNVNIEGLLRNIQCITGSNIQTYQKCYADWWFRRYISKKY